MDRIICDIYYKVDKPILGEDENSPFNKTIVAVNNMYGWLYEKGYLEQHCFEFKDYPDETWFALDVKDIEQYRGEMEKSNLKDSALAIERIFDDENYGHCRYSGAIEPSWTMNTYRSNNGVVSKSCECWVARDLNNDGANKIAEVRFEKGIKEAVSFGFAQYTWEPTIDESKKSLADVIKIADFSKINNSKEDRTCEKNNDLEI